MKNCYLSVANPRPYKYISGRAHFYSAIYIAGGYNEVDDGDDLEYEQGDLRQVAPVYIVAHILVPLQGFPVQHRLRAGRLLETSAQVLRHPRWVYHCYQRDPLMLLHAQVRLPLFRHHRRLVFPTSLVQPAHQSTSPTLARLTHNHPQHKKSLHEYCCHLLVLMPRESAASANQSRYILPADACKHRVGKSVTKITEGKILVQLPGL